MQFIHSVLIQDEAITPATIRTWNLPVNPISHLLLTLRFQNSTANTKATLTNLLSCIDNLEILHRGAAVIALNGRDLAVFTALHNWNSPWWINTVDTLNAARALTLIIPFGRHLYSPTECFPATRSGDLRLRASFASSFPNITNLTLQLETVELPEASPTLFLRATTMSRTPAATGELDIDIPPTTIYEMLILYSTTVPSGGSFIATIDYAQLLVNGVQYNFAKTNWESLHNALSFRLPQASHLDDHYHRENLGAAYTQNALTAPPQYANDWLANYALMDFDPTGDGTYLLDVTQAQKLTLRINAGDTQELRIIPVELVAVERTQQPGGL